jgi:hypothetical protein
VKARKDKRHRPSAYATEFRPDTSAAATETNSIAPSSRPEKQTRRRDQESKPLFVAAGRVIIRGSEATIDLFTRRLDADLRLVVLPIRPDPVP